MFYYTVSCIIKGMQLNLNNEFTLHTCAVYMIRFTFKTFNLQIGLMKYSSNTKVSPNMHM